MQTVARGCLVSNRDLFDRLRSDGWSVIERWVEEQEAETNHLEFKKKHDPTIASIDIEDCDEIAKSLSAFANTGGGVLVIGIDAGAGTKKGAGFDRVRSVATVADVEGCGGSLERRIKSFTEPPIDGLSVIAIRKPSTTSGVLVIDVPMSDGGPHRATNASARVNDRYYMRTAAGAQTIPHSLLADRFGRAANPKLRLLVRLVSTAPLSFVFSLTNIGRGVARRPAVILRDVKLRAAVGEIVWPTGRKWEASGFVFRGLPYGEVKLDGWLLEPYEDVVVYPGVPRGVFTLDTNARVSLDAFAPFRLDYRAELHALDTQPVSGVGSLEVSSIEDLVADRDGTFEIAPGP